LWNRRWVKRFTREFKLEAVKLIKDRGVSYVQAARDLVYISRHDRSLELRFMISSATPIPYALETDWPVEAAAATLGQLRSAIQRTNSMWNAEIPTKIPTI
jgi:hypothetical protein